jgi:hypothetical protein
MKWRVWVFALVIATALPAAPALGKSAGPAHEIVYAVLAITPQQAREVAGLLRSPGTIAVDLTEATDALIETLPSLPAAIVHDVVTAPLRDWHLLRGVVTDTMEVVRRPAGEPRGLFRRTIQALHRSQLFTAGASVVRRITQPTNRTARLAIVLTARAHGLPMRAEHLDMLDRAINRDEPDLGPLLVAVVDILVQSYGRDAIRLILD